MPKKLLHFNLGQFVAGAAAIAAAATLMTFAQGAASPDFQLGIQFADEGCAGQHGNGKWTPYANKGGGESGWAGDRNLYDPDCVRLALSASANPLAKDVRACIQAGDGLYNTRRTIPFGFGATGKEGGSGPEVNAGDRGNWQCTPWASESRLRVPSEWASDSNKTDPDGARVKLETRPLPSGVTLADVRVGIQLSDHQCSGQIGAIEFTPWASRSTNIVALSNFAGDTNWYDFDCIRLFIESKLGDNRCYEEVSASQQPRVNANPYLGTQTVAIDDTGSGNKFCPSGLGEYLPTSIKMFNAVNDRREVEMTCSPSQNVLSAATPVRALEMTQEDQDVVCNLDEVVVGFYYQDTGDNGIRKVLCGPAKPGRIDYDQKKLFAHAGCHQKYCTPYYNFPSADWVMVGGRYNADHPYMKGGWYAPVKSLPPKEIACPAESPIPPPQPPPPAGTGALRVHRFGRTTEGNPGPAALNTQAGISQTNLVSDQPAVFLQLSAGSYPVYVTDQAGEERFGLCQFILGGSGCTPPVYNPLPSSSCASGICTLPNVAVESNKMTAVVVTYAPEETVTPPPPLPASCSDGIDNDNDQATDINDSDCQSPSPGTPAPGETTITPPPPPISCTLTLSPSTIPNNEVTPALVAWNCLNTTSAHTLTILDDNPQFIDIGTVTASSSRYVSPTKTTVFTLRVKDQTNATLFQVSTTLTVTDSIGGEGGQQEF